jgi:hypothetical protein
MLLSVELEFQTLTIAVFGPKQDTAGACTEGMNPKAELAIQP